MISAQKGVGRAPRLAGLAAQLQPILDEAAAASGAVGAQVSVISVGDRIDLVYGSANLELNAAMTADTIVQVGSVCKVFNAALILSLVEENRLALDTPVIEYIPELRLADPAAQTTITLRQLLSMSSGLDNGPYHDHGRGEEALGRFVASLCDIPQVFPPGQGFGYSNAGSSIAGYVAQRMMGRSWDALMKERIFEPAGLMHAVTVPEELPFHRVSAGHARALNGAPPRVVRPWYLTQAQGPSGSTLTMSARDLASFGYIFINGGKAENGRRVLSEASVRAMMTPTTDVPVSAPFVGLGRKWGLGPCMDRWGHATVWGHGGGNKSGTSLFFWFPEQAGVLAIAANTPDSAEKFIPRVLGYVSKAVFGAGPAALVAPKPAIRLENAERFIGHYERYGARYEVSEQAGQLRLKEISLGSGKQAEKLGVIHDSALIPLGSGRFLIDTAENPAHPFPSMVAAVGFFGADQQGRATNVATPIITARRTH